MSVILFQFLVSLVVGVFIAYWFARWGEGTPADRVPLTFICSLVLVPLTLIGMFIIPDHLEMKSKCDEVGGVIRSIVDPQRPTFRELRCVDQKKFEAYEKKKRKPIDDMLIPYKEEKND